MDKDVNSCLVVLLQHIRADYAVRRDQSVKERPTSFNYHKSSFSVNNSHQSHKSGANKRKRRLHLAHAFFIVCYLSLIIGGLQRIYFLMRLCLNLFLRYSFIDGYCDGSVFSFCFIPGFIMLQKITA